MGQIAAAAIHHRDPAPANPRPRPGGHSVGIGLYRRRRRGIEVLEPVYASEIAGERPNPGDSKILTEDTEIAIGSDVRLKIRPRIQPGWRPGPRPLNASGEHLARELDATGVKTTHEAHDARGATNCPTASSPREQLLQSLDADRLEAQVEAAAAALTAAEAWSGPDVPKATTTTRSRGVNGPTSIPSRNNSPPRNGGVRRRRCGGNARPRNDSVTGGRATRPGIRRTLNARTGKPPPGGGQIEESMAGDWCAKPPSNPPARPSFGDSATGFRPVLSWPNYSSELLEADAKRPERAPTPLWSSGRRRRVNWPSRRQR